jgi:O-antigen ligase
MPMWAGLVGTLIIMFISIKPVFQAIKARLKPAKQELPLAQIQDKIDLPPVSES